MATTDALALAVLLDASSSFWSIAAQVVIRGGSLLKFSLLLVFLEPADIGFITLVMSSIAVAELLTDANLTQGLIRYERELVPRMLGAALTYSLWRIPAVMFILIIGLAVASGMADLRWDAFAAAVAYASARTLACPPVLYFHREGGFRALAAMDVAGLVVELLSTLMLLLLRWGVLAPLVGMALGEITRTGLYWAHSDYRLSTCWSLKPLAPVVDFAKWSWVSSLGTAVLNHADKFLLGYLAGVDAVGKYSTALKVASLSMHDISVGLTTTAYPRIAQARVAGPEEAVRVCRALYAKTGLWIVIASVLLTLGVTLLQPYLPASWSGIESFYPLAALPSAIGCLGLVQTTILRACNRPEAIVWGVSLQIVALLASMPALWFWWGQSGLLLAYFLAGLVAWLAMVRQSRGALGRP